MEGDKKRKNGRRVKKIKQKGYKGSFACILKVLTESKVCAVLLKKKPTQKCQISTKSVAVITIKMRENFLYNCCNIFQIHSAEYKI